VATSEADWDARATAAAIVVAAASGWAAEQDAGFDGRATYAAIVVAGASGWAAARDAGFDARATAWKTQCDLLRDIIGNRSRPPRALDPAVLAWHDGTVVRLARAMYEARDFSSMGLLADALLDAGCADEALLAHCRAGGEHIRGCWAVDLLLGKQ
jgi:hypothetical protein